MTDVGLSREQFDAVLFDLDGVVTDTASVHAEAWKHRASFDRLAEQGVVVFDSTVALIDALRRAGFGVAVASASRNWRVVLEAAGLLDRFDARVDGEVADGLGLAGKPDPAVLLEAARRLDATPRRTVVVAEAESGVEAGARGGFAFVIGVNRADGVHGVALRERGAHVVVADLEEVHLGLQRERPVPEVPDALDAWEALARRLRAHPPALFLDFDGTLSPIVDDPAAAVLPPGTRAAIERLARRCTVSVISGRDLEDVRERVGIEGLWYAGSHGFELAGPDGERHEMAEAAGALPVLEQATERLRARLAGVPGTLVERKRFALAVHHRRADPEAIPGVIAAVEEEGRRHPELRVTFGKQVVELRPDLDWDKGTALHRLVDQLALDRRRVLPVYGGDDLTDEDAFRALAGWGIAVLVRDDESADRSTLADVAVDGPDQFRRLLDRFARLIGEDRDR